MNINNIISFVYGCAATYALSYLLKHLRETDEERRKIGMLNLLLDRLLLDSKIRELDAKILRDKESENTVHDNISKVRHEINEVQEEYEDAVHRDSKVVSLRTQEEALEDYLITLQDTIEEDTIELEEMRERHDTLSEISTMEANGKNFDKVLEFQPQNIDFG